MAVDDDGADAGQPGVRPSLPAGASRRPALGPGSGPEAVVMGEREPPADVIVGPDSVFVTIELPAAERREIDVEAAETSLTVTARSVRRHYHREIPLPTPVRTDAIRATFRNGVLDVALVRQDPQRRVPIG